MNFAKFMFKGRRGKSYTCLHFSEEIWEYVTGCKLNGKLVDLYDPKPSSAKLVKTLHDFKRILKPISPCLVLMTQHGKEPHIGVFVDNKVIHLGPNVPEYVPLDLAGRGFTHFRYYA
jgi:hypothetical protein